MRNPSIYPWLALAFADWATAQTVGGCAEASVHHLSGDQVIVTPATSGVFEGHLKYAISCGSLAVEAFYDPAGARITLMIETDSAGTAAAVPASMAAQLYLLPVRRLMAAESSPADKYSLTVRNYTELGDRMATAAQKSAGWDIRRGRPASGNADEFVKRLLNSERLLTEIEGLARQLGYRVRVTDIEEVRTCRGLPCSALVAFQIYK